MNRRKKNRMTKKFLLNLSGHPISEKKHKGYIVRSEKLQVPFDDLLDPRKLYNFVNNLLFTIFSKNRDLRIAGEQGRLSYVLAGMSQVSALILAIHHGDFGHFPKIFYFVRGEQGFSLVDQPIDLQSVREHARQDRSFTV